MITINPNDMTLDELRGALARIFPLHAAFDGWSDATLTAAAVELGIPADRARLAFPGGAADMVDAWIGRSEEHTSELQSLMRISYAVFCLKKKKTTKNTC